MCVTHLLSDPADSSPLKHAADTDTRSDNNTAETAQNLQHTHTAQKLKSGQWLILIRTFDSYLLADNLTTKLNPHAVGSSYSDRWRKPGTDS